MSLSRPDAHSTVRKHAELRDDGSGKKSKKASKKTGDAEKKKDTAGTKVHKKKKRKTRNVVLDSPVNTKEANLLGDLNDDLMSNGLKNTVTPTPDGSVEKLTNDINNGDSLEVTNKSNYESLIASTEGLNVVNVNSKSNSEEIYNSSESATVADIKQKRKKCKTKSSQKEKPKDEVKPKKKSSKKKHRDDSKKAAAAQNGVADTMKWKALCSDSNVVVCWGATPEQGSVRQASVGKKSFF